MVYVVKKKKKKREAYRERLHYLKIQQKKYFGNYTRVSFFCLKKFGSGQRVTLLLELCVDVSSPASDSFLRGRRRPGCRMCCPAPSVRDRLHLIRKRTCFKAAAAREVRFLVFFLTVLISHAERALSIDRLQCGGSLPSLRMTNYQALLLLYEGKRNCQ